MLIIKVLVISYIIFGIFFVLFNLKRIKLTYNEPNLNSTFLKGFIYGLYQLSCIFFYPFLINDWITRKRKEKELVEKIKNCKACSMLAHGVKFRVQPKHTCGL